MHQEIIMSGTGGQGVMLIGRLLAQAAMMEDKNVVWFPSYGAEARGGTANCTVIVASDEIGSPMTTTPDTLIALNQESLDRFVSSVKREGIIVYNSSLAKEPGGRDDYKKIAIPASDIADELGNLRIVNMIMLGGYVQALNPVKLDSVKSALEAIIPSHRRDLLPLNVKALDRGAELVK